MFPRRGNVVRLLALVVATSATILVGCGADGLGKRFKVSGYVTYKGEPIEKGEVNFVPEDANQGRAAFGVLDKGYYSLTTLTEGDGAFAGKYKVTVTSKNVDYSEAEAFVKSKGMMNPIALPQELVSKANKNAKSNIPAKYSIASTSPLAYEVKEQSNKYDFELTD